MPAPNGPTRVKLQTGAHMKPRAAVERSDDTTVTTSQQPQRATAINHPHDAARAPAANKITAMAKGARFHKRISTMNIGGAAEYTYTTASCGRTADSVTM